MAIFTAVSEALKWEPNLFRLLAWEWVSPVAEFDLEPAMVVDQGLPWGFLARLGNITRVESNCFSCSKEFGGQLCIERHEIKLLFKLLPEALFAIGAIPTHLKEVKAFGYVK
ncbi:MAG TPA: hypothetical protein VK152_06810 [Paludibacter sp.]|nr:hypothetical protein [Paludibacter sp.]